MYYLPTQSIVSSLGSKSHVCTLGLLSLDVLYYVSLIFINLYFTMCIYVCTKNGSFLTAIVAPLDAMALGFLVSRSVWELTHPPPLNHFRIWFPFLMVSFLPRAGLKPQVAGGVGSKILAALKGSALHRTVIFNFQ